MDTEVFPLLCALHNCMPCYLAGLTSLDSAETKLSQSPVLWQHAWLARTGKQLQAAVGWV